MIPGTSYSPAKALIDFIKEFFEALAKEDYQRALWKLDVSEIRWTKEDLKNKLKEAIGDEKICSPLGFSRSASPKLEKTEKGYRLRHRLPVSGKWVDAKVIFEFNQKSHSGYFKVLLKGFER